MDRNFYIKSALLLIIILATYSCSERYLRTESATPGAITGTYTLILYGGNYANSIKNIAILAKEGTPYTFDIYEPSFDYRTIKGVPAREALTTAEKFVRSNPNFWKIQINEILAPHGGAIGYEVKPLYYPDIINTYYKMTGKKVVVFIRPQFRYPGIGPFEGEGRFGPR
jgi:hypothetical protein